MFDMLKICINGIRIIRQYSSATYDNADEIHVTQWIQYWISLKNTSTNRHIESANLVLIHGCHKKRLFAQNSHIIVSKTQSGEIVEFWDTDKELITMTKIIVILFTGLEKGRKKCTWEGKNTSPKSNKVSRAQI